ncbi:hypothetical protein GBA63_22245 (plasmid) [Rubrobacter tropicus]|uniref:Uncharacterized protein n=1 Tax=Rubrobacter tropicus TaxID=2653851 RepID=A0A6G8QFZ8_9ACTN|nr:hypothetical protein [Rubrobacter tropicus]QIN85424.1 hypothetical protein GBA63_22245 [Rubrobacter tropicus]
MGRSEREEFGAGGVGTREAARPLVLVSLEPRAYGGAIARAVQGLRPRLRIRTVEPEALGREVTCSDPALVICSRPEVGELAGRPAFVEFRPYEKPAARVRVGGRCQELDEVGLEDLLRVADETEQLTRGLGMGMGRAGRNKGGRPAGKAGAGGAGGGGRDTGPGPTPGAGTTDAGTPEGGA